VELDYLVLAAHPDDAELHCGGLLIEMGRRGYNTGVLDLSRGEAASVGTVAQRERETAAANELLALSFRDNLGLPDGALADDLPARKGVIEVIRRHRVKVLIAPLPPCRHPDHSATAQLARSVMFFSGAGGFPSELPPHRPERLLFHLEHRDVTPSFVVNISDSYEDKLRAVACYSSQFGTADRETGTVVGSKAFHQRLDARARLFGRQIGCTFGEGYVTEDTLRIDDPLRNHREG